MLAIPNFPNVPVLLIDADKIWDPALLQSMLRRQCDMRTFHLTVAHNDTLLCIALGSPGFRLVVVIDPFTPVG